MEPDFNKEQIKEMYQIQFEIHDALRDKSMNTGGINRISVVEIGWLMGIEEILDKIHKEKIPELQDSG